MIGRHNVLNALAAVAAVEKVGIDPQKAMESLAFFKGVSRRQQVSHVNSDIMLIDDFAHHPSEVRETLAGFRLRFPKKRLITILSLGLTPVADQYSRRNMLNLFCLQTS